MRLSELVALAARAGVVDPEILVVEERGDNWVALALEEREEAGAKVAGPYLLVTPSTVLDPVMEGPLVPVGA